MIRPKVSRSVLARAFSGGTVLVEPVMRPHDTLPLTHWPPPAAPPPTPPPPPRVTRARPVALCVRVIGAVVAMYHSQHGGQALAVRGARWDATGSAALTCTHVPALSTLDGVVLLLCLAIADDAAAWAFVGHTGCLATACRHAAGVLSAYAAAGVEDACAIAVACVAVTCWPCGDRGGNRAPRAAWLVAWAAPMLSLAVGVAQGGGVLPLAAAALGWLVLVADASADRSPPVSWGRAVREVACEACIVAGAVGTGGAYAAASPC